MACSGAAPWLIVSSAHESPDAPDNEYPAIHAVVNITAGNALSSASKGYLTIIGIASTTTGQYGYYADAGDYITVQDCILTGGSSGIYSNAVPHITVSNVTSNQTSVGASYYGARFSGAGSDTLTINGLAVTSNGYGLRIANFTTQNISNVTVKNSGVRHAIWFEMANSMTITGSNIAATCLGTNTGYAGICFEGNAASGLDIDLSKYLQQPGRRVMVYGLAKPEHTQKLR